MGVREGDYESEGCADGVGRCGGVVPECFGVGDGAVVDLLVLVDGGSLGRPR